MATPSVILASTSPRRQELFALLQIPFEVVAPQVSEAFSRHVAPVDQVQQLALEKAQSVAARFPAHPVLGGDTLLELDGEMIGKPQNAQEATVILRRLQGRVHRVHTGIALVHHHAHFSRTAVDTAIVQLKPLSDKEIARYVATELWRDKAGGYAIQNGDWLIEWIEGDYLTIVGFPLRLVVCLLRSCGIPLPHPLSHILKKIPYSNQSRFQPHRENDFRQDSS
ncbi:MAG: septum formation protein Maf [Nitrospirae bacterium]|nr:MAG: septum formation protein Maf [Nitrospirota bacterium]